MNDEPPEKQPPRHGMGEPGPKWLMVLMYILMFLMVIGGSIAAAIAGIIN